MWFAQTGERPPHAVLPGYDESMEMMPPQVALDFDMAQSMQRDEMAQSDNALARALQSEEVARATSEVRRPPGVCVSRA